MRDLNETLMDVTDSKTHRSLMYLAAASRRTAGIEVRSFDEYSERPDRRTAKYRTKGGMLGDIQSLAQQSIETFLKGVGGTSELVSPGESVSQYFVRLGWAYQPSAGLILISDLGKAILSELNNPRIDVDSDDPISVIVDPEDPLAYARIFDLIAASGSGLIVDPYLRMPQIFELLQIPSVTRILASNREIQDREGIIAHALAAKTPSPLLGLVDHSALHDRFYISDSGGVLIFGSSLNSITRRPGVVTPIADQTAAHAIRSAYEAVWETAELIEPLTPEDS
ncbi:hypothetical protein [Herbiconiux solani]|uniref:hypothetical protein n=1 Tax=Herbiconiux solani TaxID=661329 RepID=UPI0012ECE4AB|nr:hypothetical protein [Herbiconiux solani]